MTAAKAADEEPSQDKLSQTLAGLLSLSDEQLKNVQMIMPWQPLVNSTDAPNIKDADGFERGYASSKEIETWTRERSQQECWKMFHRNPQVNTSVRGLTGRIVGWGFETASLHPEIHAAIKSTMLDWRNQLYDFLPKYLNRSNVEGELYLIFTVHTDGFIEVDFLDPSRLNAGGDDDSGIIFHPSKSTLPLFYNVSDEKNTQMVEQIPSVFVARDPSMVKAVENHNDYEASKQPRTEHGAYSKIGGFRRFVVSWQKGLITRRAISHLRTTIEWLNHYEQLKKYEIDHKKSSGAYAWIFTFSDVKTFKLWASLSDAQRSATGLMQAVVPGARLFVPPGIEAKVVSPQLPNISDTDTDILEMAASGMNEPRDTMTGSAKGTYGGIKASRGPMSDRTSDEIAYFDRWWRYSFWGSVFFLKAAMGVMKSSYKVEEAIGFKNGEPVFGRVAKMPEELVEVNYPTSESIDYESRAKGLMGTKHGPLPESLGIARKGVADRMGLGCYGRQRLQKATEDKLYPKLIYTQDDESIQEKVEGERGKETGNGKNDKGNKGEKDDKGDKGKQ